MKHEELTGVSVPAEDNSVLPSELNENEAIQDENTENEDAEVSFEDLGLDEYTLAAVERKGFKLPSPIQVLAIPRLLDGDTNLIARARTGTGKTAAFGLPIIQSIKEKASNVQALILEPTRELAMQTCTEMQSFSSNGIPRTCVLYGGASYSTQIKELKRGCEIVVGTPGRIKDHLEKKTLDLSKIKYFILDEGDEMLDMGFIDDIREIFAQANPEARILLFSATMPAPILKIAADFMGEYDIIEEEKVVDQALAIDQKFWVVRENEKIEALVRLIDMSPDFYGLVFTMTKMDADNVTRLLDLKGYEAAALHGDIMQNQREKVLERFRSKKTRILVATDVAARGIDISGISHVVNYSLPFDAATYVHRIGRTGRAGAEGIAVTFVRPEERRKLTFLQRAVSKASKGQMKEEKIPSVNEVLAIKEKRLIEELKAKLFEGSENKAEEISEELAENELEAEVIESSENTSENTSEENLQEEKGPKVNPKLLNKKFVELAQDLIQNQKAEEVLAGVLSILYGDKLSSKHYGKISQTKDFAPKGDQMRVFISLGKKDGYRAREIADYFSNMLHIPGRLVDQIDVAQQFSLVNLPVASAKKAVEMSKNDKRLPHMHFDMKEEGRGSRKGSRSSGRDRDSSEKRGERSRKDRDSRTNNGRREKRMEGRSKGNRPNVHTQSERTSSRSANKSNAKAFIKKAERF
ncbi:MAG: DEAD/DEAH box helicase [Treponema sp.]|nr:DEAD/DEAH box helicase [Treponema sp.]